MDHLVRLPYYHAIEKFMRDEDTFNADVRQLLGKVTTAIADLRLDRSLWTSEYAKHLKQSVFEYLVDLLDILLLKDGSATTPVVEGNDHLLLTTRLLQLWHGLLITLEGFSSQFIDIKLMETLMEDSRVQKIAQRWLFKPQDVIVHWDVRFSLVLVFDRLTLHPMFNRECFAKGGHPSIHQCVQSFVSAAELSANHSSTKKLSDWFANGQEPLFEHSSGASSISVDSNAFGRRIGHALKSNQMQHKRYEQIVWDHFAG